MVLGLKVEPWEAEVMPESQRVSILMCNGGTSTSIEFGENVPWPDKKSGQLQALNLTSTNWG